MSTHWKWKVLGLAACLIITGCHPGPANMMDVDLDTRHEQIGFGQLYQAYAMATKINRGVPPRRTAELMLQDTRPEKLARVRPEKLARIRPETLQALKNGFLVVVWGVEQDEASKAVLAYEKNALKQGGQVLLANGGIKFMTASELLAALKGAGS